MAPNTSRFLSSIFVSPAFVFFSPECVLASRCCCHFLPNVQTWPHSGLWMSFPVSASLFCSRASSAKKWITALWNDGTLEMLVITAYCKLTIFKVCMGFWLKSKFIATLLFMKPPQMYRLASQASDRARDSGWCTGLLLNHKHPVAMYRLQVLWGKDRERKTDGYCQPAARVNHERDYFHPSEFPHNVSPLEHFLLEQLSPLYQCFILV